MMGGQHLYGDWVGRRLYEDYVRRYYERHPPAPGDRLCPAWADIEPEHRAKWEALAAELQEPEPAQQSLF